MAERTEHKRRPLAAKFEEALGPEDETEELQPPVDPLADEATQDDDRELYTVMAPRSHAAPEGEVPLPLAPEEGAQIPLHQLEFIHDVPLTLCVEIGRTQLTVRDVLQLGVNAVVPFPKVVGEPMDIAISRRLMARGEVVVVNERYGVRISEVTRSDESEASLRAEDD